MTLRCMQSNLSRLLTLTLAILCGGFLSFGTVATPAHAASSAIIPGSPWADNNSNLIQAHGGGITQVDSTYYWFGEGKTNEADGKAFFQNIPCYASTDLTNWTFVDNALIQQASGDLGPNRIIERPKVIYNDTTNQYVMYMHVDTPNYSAARVGIATSSNICGPYTYLGSSQPLGYQSRDMGLFKDSDGSAYLLSEDRVNGLRIDQLSSDYLSVISSVAVLADYEAPALFKANGLYYLFGSHLSGWNTNDNQYTTSTSLAGPWSAWRNFAPSGTHTYNSQTTLILPVIGSQGTTFIYMGDRWNPADLGDSPYIWLPLQVSDTSVSMSWHSSWSIDIPTGTWQDLGTPHYKLINSNSNKLLEVFGASTADGGIIDQWGNNGGNNQQWDLVNVTNTSYYKLVNHNSGKVLDVAGFTTADGGKVDQWTDNGGTNQQWSIVSINGSTSFKIVNRNSGKVLEVGSSSTTDGAIVDQWADHSSPNQQWSLVQA